METLSGNSNITEQTNPTEDPQFKILQTLVELNPQEPFSVGRIALLSGVAVKEALMVLFSIEESGEGFLRSSYLYRDEAGQSHIYDKETALSKVSSGEIILDKLCPRFETTLEFRSQIPSG